jgi:hypothetical protein
MSLDQPFPTGRAGRRLVQERIKHAESLRRDAKTYRITTTGDGAGISYVTGDWAALVKAVTDLMTFKATNDDLIDTHEMLTEGIDGDPGWDGKSVHCQFEDGSLMVELVTATS